jgi:hypothetical protein
MGMPVWEHVMTVAHEENCQYRQNGHFRQYCRVVREYTA